MNLSAFSVELKVGTPIGDYRLPVVTRGAKPWEGRGIARAWVIATKVFPVYQCPMTMFVPARTVVGTGGRFVKVLSFLLIGLSSLC